MLSSVLIFHRFAYLNKEFKKLYLVFLLPSQKVGGKNKLFYKDTRTTSLSSFCVFAINFKYISHLLFLLLTSNR